MREADTSLQPETAAAPAPDRSAARWVLAASIVAMLATVFAPPLLRIYGTEIWQALGITEVQWSIFLAARGLFLIVFVLAAGSAGDLFGRRRVLLSSLFGYLVIGTLAAFSPERTTFLLMASLLPILDAFVKTMTVTLVIVTFEGQDRLTALVTYSAFSLIAYSLSPWLATTLGQGAGVRAVAYLLTIVLAVTGLIMVAKKVPESQASANLRPRNLAALDAWVAGLCTIIFAVVLGIALGWRSPLFWGSLVAGGALLLAVEWLEIHPLRQEWKFELKFERRLSVAILAGVILNLALYAVVTQIFGFLRRIQQHDLFTAVLMLVPIAATPILLGAVASRLTIRVGVRNALSIGLLLVAASAAGYGFLHPEISYWVVALFLAVLGFGFIIGNAPYLLLLSSSVPGDLEATVQSIGRTTSQMGSSLAYALMLALMVTLGQGAVARSAEAAGLSQAGVQQQLQLLAAEAGDISAFLVPEVGVQVLEWISPRVALAYTAGLSQAMLVLAGLCVIAAILVRVVLADERL